MDIGKVIGAGLVLVAILGGVAAREQIVQVWSVVIFGGSGLLLLLTSAR